MNLLSNNLRLQILAFLEECCEPREKSIKSSMCALMRATSVRHGSRARPPQWEHRVLLGSDSLSGSTTTLPTRNPRAAGLVRINTPRC
jgi:hypothetical protein